MIPLGLRLTVAGGREALTRLLITAVAVAVGVTMLLGTLAVVHAIGAQNSRGAWLATGSGGGPPRAGRTTNDNPDALWWQVQTQPWGNSQTIIAVAVAPLGRGAPVPPGIPRLPAPGQYYVSPALAALLRTTPYRELGERFSGTEVGIIGTGALPSTQDLIIVTGERPDQLAGAPNATLVTHYDRSSTTGGPDSLGTTGLDIAFGVLALVLLFPVLVFISTAARISAARREQRLAAMRLVGATMGQVSIIAAVEAAVAALAGVAIGTVAFFLIRPILYHVPFTGHRFDAGDLTVGAVEFAVVLVGVPLAAMVAARVALRRVRVTPLGVSRRVTPKRPSVARVVPLTAGIALLAYFVAAGHPASAGGQVQGYLLGFFLVMVGVVLAGPWLVMALAKVSASRTRRAPLLLAGRRLSDNPRGAFRSIGSLILAMFVTSVTAGIMSTLLANQGPAGSSEVTDTVTDQFAFTNAGYVESFPAPAISELRGMAGVRGVTVVYNAPAAMKVDGSIPHINGLSGLIQDGVVSCRDLRMTPALGVCARGATYAGVGDDIGYQSFTKSDAIASHTTWPAATLPGGTRGLPIQLVAVATDGSPSAIARVEAVFERAEPFVGTVGTLGHLGIGVAQIFPLLQTSSDVIILTSLVIAGCSLAVAVTSGLNERRRPFALLRLTGVPVAKLRRVVMLETAAPLVVIALGAVALGLGSAALFLRAQIGESLRIPGAGYFGIVLGGLLVAFVVIALTLPVLERITRAENARQD